MAANRGGAAREIRRRVRSPKFGDGTLEPTSQAETETPVYEVWSVILGRPVYYYLGRDSESGSPNIYGNCGVASSGCVLTPGSTPTVRPQPRRARPDYQPPRRQNICGAAHVVPADRVWKVRSIASTHVRSVPRSGLLSETRALCSKGG
jgi:hypothetical protein